MHSGAPQGAPFHPRHNSRNPSKHWSFSFSHAYPNHLKKSALHLLVEPGGVEPPSKQATPAAFSMLSPRLVFDQGLTVDGPPLT